MFLPVPFFLWQRRFPKSWIRYVSTPVILNGVGSIPPATGINYSSWFAVGFIFQYLIRKKNFAWWSKFNYVLSSALDSGTVISVMVIFFCLQFPANGSIEVNWWGNSVFRNSESKRDTSFFSLNLMTFRSRGLSQNPITDGTRGWDRVGNLHIGRLYPRTNGYCNITKSPSPYAIIYLQKYQYPKTIERRSSCNFT